MSNSQATTTTAATSKLWLPTKVFHNTFEAIASRFGLTATGTPDNNGFREMNVPADWQIADSTESPFQKRLVAGDGTHIAKLFYKPGSQGGGGAMQLLEDESKG